MCPKEDKEVLEGDADVPAKMHVEPQFPHLQFTPTIPFEGNVRYEAEIVCGDRSILLRGATGEQGPKGQFPFITMAGEVIQGFCVHSEDVFDELWDKLKELMPSRE